MKYFPARRLFLLLSVATSFMGFASGSRAEWPDKPIKFIVPYPAGGGNDILARQVAEGLSERLKQTVLVDNRGGASTTIGADMVAKAAPDGYTMLLATVTTLAVVPNIKRKLTYDPIKGFEPVSMLALQPYVLVLHPSVPARNYQQLMALAKASPGKLTFASTGNDSGAFIAGEMFKDAAGIDMLHVPYKGTGPAINDLLGGQVSMFFATVPSVQQHIKVGKLVPIAVTTASRSPALPEVPTLAELGLAGYETNSWNALLLPKGTPSSIVNRLNAEVNAVLQSPAAGERLRQQGFVPQPGSVQDLSRYIAAEYQRYGTVVKKLDIKED